MVSEESACCCSRGYGRVDLQCGHLPEMEANGEGKVPGGIGQQSSP